MIANQNIAKEWNDFRVNINTYKNSSQSNDRYKEEYRSNKGEKIEHSHHHPNLVLLLPCGFFDYSGSGVWQNDSKSMFSYFLFFKNLLNIFQH